MHFRLKSLKFPRRWKKSLHPRNNLHFALHYRIIVFYATASILLSCALMSMGIIDLVLLLGLEKPHLTTHNSLVTIMILHSISFYLSVFGFIYSFETRLYTLTILSIISGGVVSASLLMRIIQELVLAGFYPPEYAVS